MRRRTRCVRRHDKLFSIVLWAAKDYIVTPPSSRELISYLPAPLKELVRRFKDCSME